MKISGKIVDIDNVPLSGANVTLRSGIKSGKVGTIADFEGYFYLESEEFSETDLFEVSYIGFTPQLFKANELKEKKIMMLESVTAFDEVVLVGTKKTDKKPTIQEHLKKNKYAYAGVVGLLGISLIILSTKN